MSGVVRARDSHHVLHVPCPHIVVFIVRLIRSYRGNLAYRRDLSSYGFLGIGDGILNYRMGSNRCALLGSKPRTLCSWYRMGPRQDRVRNSAWAHISYAPELLGISIISMEYSAYPTLVFYFVVLREPWNLHRSLFVDAQRLPTQPRETKVPSCPLRTACQIQHCRLRLRDISPKD